MSVKSENSVAPCRQVGVASVSNLTERKSSNGTGVGVAGVSNQTEQKTSNVMDFLKHTFLCDVDVLAGFVIVDFLAASSFPSTSGTNSNVKVCGVLVFD